jgi:hypothetical protein
MRELKRRGRDRERERGRERERERERGRGAGQILNQQVFQAKLTALTASAWFL